MDDTPSTYPNPLPERTRADAQALVALMRRATGDEPWIDRSMVGFGTCHQRYPSDLGVLGAVVRSSYGRSPPTCREPGEGR